MTFTPISDGRPRRWLDAASEPARLQEGWMRVAGNRGAPGGDGISIDQFGQAVTRHLARLSAELRSGTYRPAPARKLAIPKKSGGTRTLTIPSVVDRVAQAAVALTIGPTLDAEMEDSSFAYRRGRGVVQAVRRVATLRRQGFRWTVDADIDSYFDSIPHERLLDRLERSTGDDALIDLIAHWLEWYAPGGVGVPQGSPISPLLANLYLDDVDEAMAAHGLRLVRYADDFVLLAKHEAAAERGLERVTAILAEQGLTLNQAKTRIVPYEQGLTFLGHRFIRSMVLRELDEAGGEDTPDGLAPEAVGLWQADDRPAFVEDAPATGGPRAPGWRVLYVFEPDRTIDAQGDSLIVRAGGQAIFAQHMSRIGRVEIGSDVNVTSAALELAAAHAVVIARVDGHGETIAEWLPPTTLHLHGARHLAQAAVILDPVRRVTLARTLVDGRIKGQRAVLSRANRSRSNARLTEVIAQFRRVLRQVAVADSVEALMGWEGHAASLYWPALAVTMDGDLSFSGKRRRKEGAEAFDVVLNALSGLVARDVRVALMRHGLHSGFAALHSPADRHEPLVYDLMEEFRAPLVEAAAVALVNRKAVRATMFEAERSGRVRMNRDGWQAVIKGYETLLDRPSASALRGGDKVNWRKRMDDQAVLLVRHYEEGEPYVPVKLDY